MGLFIIFYCLIVVGLIVLWLVYDDDKSIINKQQLIISELEKAEERVFASLTFNNQKLAEIAIADFDFYLELYKNVFGIDERYQYWLKKRDEIVTFSK
jgi:hypothetical protein